MNTKAGYAVKHACYIHAVLRLRLFLVLYFRLCQAEVVELDMSEHCVYVQFCFQLKDYRFVAVLFLLVYFSP